MSKNKSTKRTLDQRIADLDTRKKKLETMKQIKVLRDSLKSKK